mmetsp:Transcript_54536/g.100934  ORF Transcript_54536/g.100934 Transcript_54536/m.100934 type:complete len:715 (-) Transcript_54536:49-2193(-)
MKFGKQIKRLAPESHHKNYLAYDVLKKAINVVTAKPNAVVDSELQGDINAVQETFGVDQSSTSLASAETKFHALLKRELKKVNRFAALQLQTSMEKLQQVQRPLADDSPLSEKQLAECSRQLDEAGMALCDYESFRRLNYTGFRKIAKKFDKQCDASQGGTKFSLSAWFLPQLERESFVKSSLDDHLLALAWGYAAIRRKTAQLTGTYRPRATSHEADTAAASATGKTTTFLLSAQSWARSLCVLVKHFDILHPSNVSPEGLGRLREQDWRQRLVQNADGIPKATNFLGADVHTTYYDFGDFQKYRRQLAGTEGESMIRARRVCSKGQPNRIYNQLVERDAVASALSAHPFTSEGRLISPDAFPVPPLLKEVGGLHDQAQSTLQALKGDLSDTMLDRFDGDAKNALIAWVSEVANATAVQKGLKPVATVASERVLLRGGTDETRGLTLGFDKDISMVKGAASVSDPSAVFFPFFTLEVAGLKSGNGSWLEELKECGALHAFTGFSLGLHAVSRCNSATESLSKPEWADFIETTELTTPYTAMGMAYEIEVIQREMEEEARKRANSEADATAASAYSIDSEPILPKNLLASERTMLEWMHTSMALAVLGIGLWKVSLQGGDDSSPLFMGILCTAQLSSVALGLYGLIILGVAIAFMWQAVLAHISRLDCMEAKPAKLIEGKFNSRAAVVGLAMSIAVTLAFHLFVQVWGWLTSSA